MTPHVTHATPGTPGAPTGFMTSPNVWGLEERHWGARVAMTLLVHRIGAAGCREHGDAHVRWGTRVDGWFLDVKV